MSAMLNDSDADTLAVHSVDEFVFGVPALEQARHFYTHFGLDVRDDAGALALYTDGHTHRWARILPRAGHVKRLLWISLGIYEKDEPRFRKKFANHQIAYIAAPDGADPSGLWIKGPDGLAVQLRVAEKCSPSQPGPRAFPPPSGHAGRAPRRSLVQQTRPLHLSHVLLFTGDVKAARRFYEGLLGLRMSDSSDPVIAFLHTPHGSDHHLIALAKSDGAGLHHSSWCVPSFDAIGHGAQQMAQAGYTAGWGLGRHVLGSNYFQYVRDPWGSYAEYSFDIDHIAAGQNWPADDHPGEDSLYVWGPEVPEDFIFNYESCNG